MTRKKKTNKQTRTPGLDCKKRTKKQKEKSKKNQTGDLFSKRLCSSVTETDGCVLYHRFGTLWGKKKI